ncbi:MAG: DUF4157 domain-containing protein [Myxococcales bacterium]|nr:DUF4157 domain-containing protein [Myxococcales bacterium]
MHKQSAPDRRDPTAAPAPASRVDVPHPAHVMQRVAGNQAVLRGRAGPVTGLPGDLQSALEARGGVSLAGVRVHHDSPEPARHGALAFTRGGDIHLGVGQARHLEHEAWHAVQQAQGRVPATGAIHGQALNDDPALEREADGGGRDVPRHGPGHSPPVMQRIRADRDAHDHWISDLHPGAIVEPGEGYIRVTSFGSTADTRTGALANQDHAYVGIEYVDASDAPHTAFTDLTHNGVRYHDDHTDITGGIELESDDGQQMRQLLGTKMFSESVRGGSVRTYVGTSYRISAQQATDAIARARDILKEYGGVRPRGGRDYKYKFARTGHTLTRDHGINCARFAEKILKAANIKASAGKAAKTPYEAANLQGGAHGLKVLDATDPARLDASALTKSLASMASVTGKASKFGSSIASRYHRRSLDSADKAAIKDWVAGDWSSFNKYVRGLLSPADQKTLEGITINNKKVMPFADRVTALNRALDKLDAFDGTSYRWSRTASPDVYKHLIRPGDYVSDRGYSASSMLKGGEGGASGWGKAGNVHFELRGTSGRDISQHSPMAGEREVLFKPNTIFKVEAIKVESDNTTYVVLREVSGSGGKAIKNSYDGSTLVAAAATP